MCRGHSRAASELLKFPDGIESVTKLATCSRSRTKKIDNRNAKEDCIEKFDLLVHLLNLLVVVLLYSLSVEFHGSCIHSRRETA